MTDETIQYKQLIESIPAIPWKIDWHTKQFSYVGPQVEKLLGWPRESWLSMDTWVKRVHPLDRDRVLALQAKQIDLRMDFETEYAILTISGDYILVHDIVHVARNQEGNVDALMGFLRQIRSAEIGAIIPDL